MDRNDLISRSELKSVFKNECFWCANRDEPCDKSCWHCINEKIDNAPTVKTYCYFCGQTEHGQVVPDTLQGWKYEDKQITIEEYMQSLKGEKNERRR